MILDEPVSNVPLAAFHARRLAGLFGLGAQSNLDAVLRPLLTNGFASSFFPATGNAPTVYVGGNGQRKIIYLGGIPGSAAALSFILSYNNAAGGGTARVFNSWVRNAANIVFGYLTNAHFQESEYLDFVGYSVGGAVATEMVRLLVNAQSVTKRKLFTFGAPRSHNQDDRGTLGSTAIARYMVDADPIPLIPPRLTDAPAIIAVTGPLEVLRWGQFVHTDGGISIDASGVTSAAVLPPIASINTSTSLASWYFAAENDPANPHSINQYVGRLSLAETAMSVPGDQDADQGGPEFVIQQNKREVNRERERRREQIVNAGHAQNAVEVVIPDVALFKAVRLDRIWVVYFGERIVCQAPIEKRARHIARAGNDFLRSLPKQALVDPIALAGQLTTFLAEASSPESAIKPTLRTNLDQ